MKRINLSIIQKILFRFLIIFVALCSTTYAKDADISIYAGYSQPSLTVQVDDGGTEQQVEEAHKVVYAPKLPNILVIGGSYKWLSLSYSQDIESSSSEETLNYKDYGFGLHYSWFGIDAAYSQFERFRIQDSEGFDQELPETEKNKPGMDVRFLGSNLYVFPFRFGFDFERAFDASMTKTNGLGIGGIASWNKLSIKTKNGLLPSVWQQAFGGDGEFTSGELEGTNFQVAIAGTLALGPLYLSGLIAMGPGQHQFSYVAGASERSGSGRKQKINERILFGYSGKTIFSAFEINQESPDYVLKFMTLGAARTDINFKVGMKW